MRVKKYYNNLSESYFCGSDQLTSYHKMRLEACLFLIDSCSSVKKVFDFACGSGEITKILKELGFAVSGCDISEEMVRLANEQLGNDCVELGGLECIDKKEKLDLLLALNALPYLSESDEEEFFKLSNRALKKGGYVLLSHTNTLFDLMTFNKYTVTFWDEHLIKPFATSDAERSNLLAQFRSLLTGADQPLSNGSSWKGEISASEREVLTKRRVDPFQYPDYVEQFGFKIEGFVPINCFPLPPLIIENDAELIKRQHQFHQQLKDKTLARLLCSQFQMLCKKV